MQKACQYRL